MATSIQETHCYPETAEQLFDVHSTPDLIVTRYSDIQARNAKVLQSDFDGDQYQLHTQREINTNLPPALAAFANEWNTITQKERWNKTPEGAYQCNFDLEIEGLPGKASGSMFIQNTDTGCSNEIELSVSCAIPFIDKQVEAFILSECMESINAEHLWVKNYFSSE